MDFTTFEHFWRESSSEIIGGLLVVLITVVFYGFKEGLRRLALKASVKVVEPVSYTKKLKDLTDHLTRSSNEMDSIFEELAKLTEEKTAALNVADAKVQVLENRELELKGRIELLEKVPIPVAEEFAKITSSGEQRSARRDYILFGAGVLVSTTIAIILKLLGLG